MVRLFSLLLLFVLVATTIPGKGGVDAAAASVVRRRPTQLVDRICKQTSEYSVCVDSLYSDLRTPQADQFTLAYISVGLAYNQAVETREFISSQLQLLLLLLRTNNNNASSTTEQHNLLLGCAADYDSAVSKMAMASNDLDSETYFELPSLSRKASLSAHHCQMVFPSSTALTARNHHFRALCQIVGAVSKLFTGGTIS